MKKIASLSLAALTTFSLLGLAAPSADAATTWHCSGKLTKRCITKSGTKVKVKFSNTTSRSATGKFGVTCFGPDGQSPKVFKDGRIDGYDTYTSPWFQCPKGTRTGASGWQMSNGKVYRTPEVRF